MSDTPHTENRTRVELARISRRPHPGGLPPLARVRPLHRRVRGAGDRTTSPGLRHQARGTAPAVGRDCEDAPGAAHVSDQSAPGKIAASMLGDTRRFRASTSKHTPLTYTYNTEE
jgi:hypothetical protein